MVDNIENAGIKLQRLHSEHMEFRKENARLRNSEEFANVEKLIADLAKDPSGDHKNAMEAKLAKLVQQLFNKEMILAKKLYESENLRLASAINALYELLSHSSIKISNYLDEITNKKNALNNNLHQELLKLTKTDQDTHNNLIKILKKDPQDKAIDMIFSTLDKRVLETLALAEYPKVLDVNNLVAIRKMQVNQSERTIYKDLIASNLLGEYSVVADKSNGTVVCSRGKNVVFTTKIAVGGVDVELSSNPSEEEIKLGMRSLLANGRPGAPVMLRNTAKNVEDAVIACMEIHKRSNAMYGQKTVISMVDVVDLLRKSNPSQLKYFLEEALHHGRENAAYVNYLEKEVLNKLDPVKDAKLRGEIIKIPGVNSSKKNDINDLTIISQLSMDSYQQGLSDLLAEYVQDFIDYETNNVYQNQFYNDICRNITNNFPKLCKNSALGTVLKKWEKMQSNIDLKNIDDSNNLDLSIADDIIEDINRYDNNLGDKFSNFSAEILENIIKKNATFAKNILSDMEKVKLLANSDNVADKKYSMENKNTLDISSKMKDLITKKKSDDISIITGHMRNFNCQVTPSLNNKKNNKKQNKGYSNYQDFRDDIILMQLSRDKLKVTDEKVLTRFLSEAMDDKIFHTSQTRPLLNTMLESCAFRFDEIVAITYDREYEDNKDNAETNTCISNVDHLQSKLDELLNKGLHPYVSKKTAEVILRDNLDDKVIDKGARRTISDVIGMNQMEDIANRITQSQFKIRQNQPHQTKCN